MTEEVFNKALEEQNVRGRFQLLKTRELVLVFTLTLEIKTASKSSGFSPVFKKQEKSRSPMDLQQMRTTTKERSAKRVRRGFCRFFLLGGRGIRLSNG